MYTFVLNESNELVTTVYERLMQRSKLVDSLRFLVEPVYKGLDMSEFTVVLEYLLPVSREYQIEYLERAAENYKDWFDYRLPLDTKLTREAGDIEIQLTFTKVSLQPDGKSVQLVRKISPATVTILPISAWSDIIADNALTALDQRLIQTQAMIEAANEVMSYIDATKADNLILDKNNDTLQLSSNGIGIGDIIPIRDMIEDGVPVVELTSESGSGTEGSGSDNDSDSEDDDSVVEFGDHVLPEIPDDDDVVEF